jgi:hypothetical protein
MKGFENDYERRLRSVIARRTAPVEILAKSTSVLNEATIERYQASPIYEIYNKLDDEGTAVQYTVAAMARLDPRYTEITYEQGERVRKQLDRAFTAAEVACDFDYQGSVTNDTHIKSYSDIDLLCITQKYTTLEPPQKPSYPYTGNPVKDLTDIRVTGADALRKAYPTAAVDDSGAKSVSISGGSLSRKIDIVPANWYDTNQWTATEAKRFRAIQVLDLKTGKRVKNSPFMHNYLIEQKDKAARGGLRKVVRLMKSLRYDSGAIFLSSYDLAAIGYSMPEDQLATFPGGEIPLLSRLKSYLDYLRSDKSYREQLNVPDGSRKIFTVNHATLDGLNELQDEVDDLVEAVGNNLHKSFERLAEARLSY